MARPLFCSRPRFIFIHQRSFLFFVLTDCDETLSGDNDAGYRGCQTKTNSGATCQRWDSQIPNSHDYLANYPDGDLSSNYCRNPDGKPTIWCYTMDGDRYEYCTPMLVSARYLRECTPGHYCDGDLLEKACEAGTYAGGTSSVVCLTLSNGHYAADASGNHVTEAGVVSVVCPAGWYCSNGDKVPCDDAGDYCEEESSAPAGCAAGFFCPDTATKTECTSGSYCPARSTVESDCAGGHYCSTPASQVECEVGTFCKERSAVPEPCLSCAVGQGQIAPCTTETNTQCEACGANEVSTGGDSDCVACGNSTISNVAQSACLPCPIGEYREGGMDVCESIPCLAGTYCVTASTKKDCPKGMLIISYLSMCN
jgi:hypothetical protein